jgi:nicotinamide riboside kinase
MKIAIIGTHGIGKTTLSHIIAAYSVKKGKSTFIVSEVIRDCPFPINDQSTVEGGYWIVTEQIARELRAKAARYEVIICDRSAIDPVLYLEAMNFREGFPELKSFANKWMQTYDIVLYIEPPDIDIVSDGFRDTNKTFQKKVDDQFNLYLNSIFIDYLNINIFRINSEEIFTRGIDQILDTILGDDEWTNQLPGL